MVICRRRAIRRWKCCQFIRLNSAQTRARAGLKLAAATPVRIPPAVPAHLNSSTFQSDLLATRRSILRKGALGLRDAHGAGQGEVHNPDLQRRRAEPY
jgi:hypothetical protein